MRVAVCDTQVPFLTGGAEALDAALVRHLRGAGHAADLVTLPFAWTPRLQILQSALAWRLVGLDGATGSPDLVVAGRFPSYLVRHPNKIVWLIHQFRQVYDLRGTRWSDFGDDPADRAMVERIHEMDRRGLREARRIYTISRNTADRLRRHLGIEAEVLHAPPPLEGRLHPGAGGDYVFTVSRLDRLKRVELLVDALAAGRAGVRARIAGDGPEREALQRRIAERGVGDRVELLGRVDDDDLVRLYAGARAVFYAPYDEDYGYAAIEAFMSGKPVVTTRDSGGVLEFVEHERTGLVAAANDVGGVAAAIDRLAVDPDLAGRLGAAGRRAVSHIRWRRVVETLTEAPAGEATA